MSEVQRYDFELYHCNGGDMEKRDDGGFVSFEDYAALKAESNALAEENAQLIAGYEKVTDELSSIYHSDGWSVSEDGESDTAVIEFDVALSVVADVRSEIKTKDTDAFLLNVQADGVDKAIETLKSLGSADFSCYELECLSKTLRAQAESLKGGE